MTNGKGGKALAYHQILFQDLLIHYPDQATPFMTPARDELLFTSPHKDDLYGTVRVASDGFVFAVPKYSGVFSFLTPRELQLDISFPVNPFVLSNPPANAALLFHGITVNYDHQLIPFHRADDNELLFIDGTYDMIAAYIRINPNGSVLTFPNGGARFAYVNDHEITVLATTDDPAD